jgi:hypothetical protein
MNSLELLETDLKLFKFYGLQFNYEKKWTGVMRRCHYIATVSACFLQVYFVLCVLRKVKTVDEAAADFSTTMAFFYPNFRSVLFYLQSKNINKIFDIMTEISNDRKSIYLQQF